MKKNIRIIALVVIAILTVTMLASCAKTLSGKYEKEGLVADTYFKFSGSKVSVGVTLLGTVTEYEGTYSIDEDKITLTFTDEDAKAYGGTFAFEENDDSITIGVFKYVKK